MARPPSPDLGRLAPALVRLGAARTRTYGIIARHYKQRSTDQAILGQLNISEDVTNGALARALGMSTGGVTPAIDRLERRGLVERVPNPGDRRSSVLRLTDEGVAMMQAGMRLVSEAVREVEDTITEAEADMVLRVVEAAIAGYDRAAERLTSPEGEVARWREVDEPGA